MVIYTFPPGRARGRKYLPFPKGLILVLKFLKSISLGQDVGLRKSHSTVKSQEQRDSLRTSGEGRPRHPLRPAQPGARRPPGAPFKTGWKEKEDAVVGAGAAAAASEQISLTALFLKGREAEQGSEETRGGWGWGGGGIRGSRVWFLLPPRFPSLPACQGPGEPSAVLSKS